MNLTNKLVRGGWAVRTNRAGSARNEVQARVPSLVLDVVDGEVQLHYAGPVFPAHVWYEQAVRLNVVAAPLPVVVGATVEIVALGKKRNGWTGVVDSIITADSLKDEDWDESDIGRVWVRSTTTELMIAWSSELVVTATPAQNRVADAAQDRITELEKQVRTLTDKLENWTAGRSGYQR